MTLSPLFLALAAGLSPGPGPAPEPLKVLDAVVVVGSRSAEPVKLVVGAVSRVDREALERRGVQTIEDLARLVPGLDVGTDANRFGNAFAYVVVLIVIVLVVIGILSFLVGIDTGARRRERVT